MAQVYDQLERLSKSIEMLRESMEILRVKVGPVSAEPSPSKTASPETDSLDESMAPLANQLKELSLTLEMLNRFVIETSSLIEL